MNAYSEDLRKKKIVEALGRGATKSEAARTFGISRSSVKRYAKLANEGRPLAPERRPGLRPKLEETARKLPEEDLQGGRPPREARSDPPRETRVFGAGVRSLGQRVDREPGAEAPEMEPRKRLLGAGERDEFLRAARRALVAGEIDAARLVFVDEMGANVSLSPLYAWSRRGERAQAKAPRNWGKNVTLLASMGSEGIGPCLAVEGAATRGVFEAYLERVLAPSLGSGQAVAMDNLSAHKGGRVREILGAAGCEPWYLPPYSPDLNPIEQAFSKVKGLLRRAEARTREALIGAMGRALDAVSTQDARAFLGHCGYRSEGQPL